MTGLSGICKYSKDFYELILKHKDYIFIDSSNTLTEIMTTISSRDIVHLEIGIFQEKEIEILFAMLRSNYKNISVTLHDAPLLKYPFHSFKNPILNKLSKFYDQSISGFKLASPYLKKIKTIYVLSQKGVDTLRQKYGLQNVYYLPHIVNDAEIESGVSPNNNFIYLGFIGRNKGLEYALKLHQQLLKYIPDTNFYVVGKALGNQVAYYETLKKKYTHNVHYLGYLPEEELKKVFSKTTFALILFKDYKFFWPFSGSILYSLKKGKIILTNRINTTHEIIRDKVNGFLLTGCLSEDKSMVKQIMENKSDLISVFAKARQYLSSNHTASKVLENFKD